MPLMSSYLTLSPQSEVDQYRWPSLPHHGWTVSMAAVRATNGLLLGGRPTVDYAPPITTTKWASVSKLRPSTPLEQS
jgi:hypothetical protein